MTDPTTPEPTTPAAPHTGPGRDPRLARALLELEPPSHRPGFWAALEARLAAEAPAAATAQPPLPPVPAAGPPARTADEADVVPLDARRRRTPRLPWVVAVAASAAVVGGLVADAAIDREQELRSGPIATQPTAATTAAPDGATTAPGPLATTVSTAAATPTTAATASTTSSSSPRREPTSATAAALAWVDAVAAGDVDAGWDLLGPTSRTWWRTKARYAEAARSELPSGAYGAMGRAASPSTATTLVTSSGEGSAVVVTLTATVSVEGRSTRRVVPIPARSTSTHRVEPFAFGPGGTVPVFTSPPARGESLAPLDGGAVIAAEAIGSEVIIQVDDGPTLARPVKQGTASYDPPGRLAPGRHRIVVASLGDSWFTAAAGETTVTR